jgi:hypothetical protein
LHHQASSRLLPPFHQCVSTKAIAACGTLRAL